MLSVDIRKRLGSFRLEVQFETGDGPLALLGASGCGKSLTLRCIAGILTPDEGRITLDGLTLFDSAARKNLPPQKRHIGYLFQQYALFPHMTVWQNIAAAVPKEERKQQEILVLEKLRQFRLEDAANLLPGQLSGGQQQRAALARILASAPWAILLDEPLSALDSYLRSQLELELWETLERFGGPAVWVSHDRGEMFRACRQVCVLEHGVSQGVRTVAELMEHPETEAAARLSGCENYANAEPRGDSVHLPEWGVTLDCGRPVSKAVRRVGVWARQVRLGTVGGQNAVPCTVTRIVEDFSSMMIFLRPESASSNAPPLRMELEKAVWLTVSNTFRLTVSIPPEAILFF